MDDKKNQKNGKSNLPNYMLFFFIGQLFLMLMLFCFGWEITKPSIAENDVSITENIDIQRSIKKANNSANPINPSDYYTAIFLNYTLSADEMYNILTQFIVEHSSSLIPITSGMYAYPIYAFQEYEDDNISVVFIMYNYDSETISRSYAFVKGYLDMTITGLYGALSESSLNGEYFYRYSIPMANYITPSNNYSTITPLSSVSFGGVSIPVGVYNSVLTDVVSSVPYEQVCESTTPTYENAPSSLINDVPFNVQFPSSIHNDKYVSPTAYYPSVSGKYYGSLLGNPLSIIGAQGETYYDYKADLYINSSLRPKQNVFGFDDFISYYDSYDYIFSGFDIVIQTMWGRIPIYFKITTNDFGFSYDVSRLLNEFNTIDDYFNLSITSDVEQRFTDYVYINIQFYFNADTDYDSRFFNVNEEYELEGLIPNTYYNGEYIQAEFSYLRYDADSFITNDEVVANGAYQTLRNYRIASSNVLNRIEQAYADEYEQGYNEGYSAGIVDGGGENALGPVFAWLVSASSVIANIFSIQIFPYITLGMLLLFPLVVFVIVWILKLFFGG